MAGDDSNNQSTSDIQKHLNQLIDGESTPTLHDSSSKTKQSKKNPSKNKKKQLKHGIESIQTGKKQQKSLWQTLGFNNKKRSAKAKTALTVDDILPKEYQDAEVLDELSLNDDQQAPFSKQKRHGAIVILIFIVLLLFVGWFNSPFAKVQHYQVEGNVDLTKKEVIAAATLKDKQSTFLTYEEQGYFKQKAQANNPQIRDLSLSIKNPTTMVVKIKERPKVGYLKTDAGYQMLLANGQMVTLNQKQRPTDGYAVYSDFSNDKRLKEVNDQVGQLTGPIRRSISDVIWSPTKLNPNRLVIFMNDGNEVLVSAADVHKKMKYYPSIVAQYHRTHPKQRDKKTIIDLQVGAYGYQQAF